MSRFLKHHRINWLIIMIAILPFLLACSDEPEEISPPYGFVAPPPKFELKREVFGDPDSFDQPRIQFMWQGPKRNKKEIWSIKIDGTDLRLAADKELLYSGETSDMDIVRFPVRSPNNRYILTQFSKPGKRAHIYLIDLKEKSKKYLTVCQIWRAPWTGDSKSFFCTAYYNLYRYHLDSGQFEIIKNFGNGAIYVQQSTEHIFQMQDDGFIVWDYKGQLLRKEALGEIHNLLHYITSDGKKIIFTRGLKAYIANTSPPFSQQEIFYGNSLLSLRNSNFVIKGNIIGIELQNLESNQRKYVFIKPGKHKFNDDNGMQLGEFTLFNERTSNGLQEKIWPGKGRTN